MLEYEIMELIRDVGPIRSNDEEFAEFFSATQNEVRIGLRSLERKGIILRAAAFPGCRPVYSYNHSEFNMPATHRQKRYGKRHWMRNERKAPAENQI